MFAIIDIPMKNTIIYSRTYKLCLLYQCFQQVNENHIIKGCLINCLKYCRYQLITSKPYRKAKNVPTAMKGPKGSGSFLPLIRNSNLGKSHYPPHAPKRQGASVTKVRSLRPTIPLPCPLLTSAISSKNPEVTNIPMSETILHLWQLNLNHISKPGDHQELGMM